MSPTIALRPANHHAWQGVLTPRQAEIAEMVATGQNNIIISKELWITEQTVKFHLSAIYLKLGLTGRIQLARWWWINIERPLSQPLPQAA